MQASQKASFVDEQDVRDREVVEEEKRGIAEEKRINKLKTKSITELRSDLTPVYKRLPAEQDKYKGHKAETADGHCMENKKLWDLVGEDREWGLVFVNHLPIDRRATDAWRLLKKTRLLVIHDTESFSMIKQMDFSNNGCQWNGIPCYLDVSHPTKTVLSMGAVMTKTVWTTLIQGGRDQGGVAFRSVVDAFEENSDLLNSGYRHYNKNNTASGTYLRLLLAAAMLTHGDMLELGSGDYSTKLLHKVAEQDNGEGQRMLVTADSNPSTLSTHEDLACQFHQLVHVRHDACAQGGGFVSHWDSESKNIV